MRGFSDEPATVGGVHPTRERLCRAASILLVGMLWIGLPETTAAPGHDLTSATGTAAADACPEGQCTCDASAIGAAGPSPTGLAWLFDTSRYPPRWKCGTWSAAVGWMHITADLLTWFAYMAIPIVLLIFFLTRRREVPFPGLFLLFSAFILACGTVHLVEAIIFWYPVYQLQAVIKIATATVSIATAAVLIPVMPRALRLRSPKELEREVSARTADLQQREEELRRSRDVAERATRSKSEFLAHMSHEIRTPMTTILGYADLLNSTAVTDEQREFSSVIKSAGRHLTEVINNILDMSKIEAGKLHVERMPVDPTVVIEEAREILQVTAADQALALDVRYETDLPRRINTDPTRLRQILLNVIGNALKFTDEGGVTVSVRYERPDRHGILTLDVSDTGTGLTPEQQQRIFAPFTQADGSVTRTRGGTGLGLAISRRLAQLLGGSLTLLRSVSGEGSTFRIRIATGMALTGDEPDPESVGSDSPVDRLPRLPFRILLAEDGADAKRLIPRLLGQQGASVDVCENGREAVERALAAERAGQAYDVILMDMQMPVLDGYAATAELRNRGYRRPILALSAHAMTDERRQCIHVGCDDFAQKPIERWRLSQQIVNVTNGSAAGATADVAVGRQTIDSGS